MPASGPTTVGYAATGGASAGTLASLVREKFYEPFETLRDTEDTFIGMIPKVPCAQTEYRWIVEDATYAAVWSAGESDQLRSIASKTAVVTDGNLATDGLGTSTAILAPGSHPVIKALVTMRYNYYTVQVSGTAKAAMKAGNQTSWVDALKYETKRHMEDFWREMNIRALKPTTVVGNSGKDIDQLGVMLQTGSPTYAGINAATYPAWTVAGDTTTTVMSVAALQTLSNRLEGGTETLQDQLNGTTHSSPNLTLRESNYKDIWMSPGQADNYHNLLFGYRRFGANDTLDAGGAKIGKTGLTFKGRPILSVPRFPSGWVVFNGGGLVYAELEALDVQDKSAATVDSTLHVHVHRANLLLRNRKKWGVMTNLS